MIKRWLKAGSALLSRRQNTIVSAAMVIMATVFVSRLLGLVRERLLLAYFSVGELGPYYAAFRLPNLLFELLVMGALSTAFIPVFSNYLVKKRARAAYDLGANVINLSLLATLVALIPLLVFTRSLSALIVPGLSEAELAQVVRFTRIMLMGQLVPLMIGNYIAGMLQSQGRFLLPALAPIVYNLGIIFGVVTFSHTLGLNGAVIGVVIGAGLYLLIQIPLAYKLGFRYRLLFNYKSRGVKEVIRLMMPRTFGLAVSQIDTTTDLILASLMGARSISIFHLAQQLYQVPVGLFGATFAQAALPAFSSEAARRDMPGFKRLLLATMHQILFFVLPATVLLTVLRTPIVRIVYGTAKFDWPATVLTGMTLSFFAVSIFAASLVQLFARAFYALYDTKTPVVVGIVSVIVNTGMSLLLVLYFKLPVWALALSASSASLVHVSALFWLLNRRVKGFELGPLIIPPLKMLVATGAAGVFIYVPIKLLDQLIFDTTRVIELVMLTGVALVSGLSIYVFLAWFLDIDEVGALFKILQKAKKAPRTFFAGTQPVINDERASIP